MSGPPHTTDGPAGAASATPHLAARGGGVVSAAAPGLLVVGDVVTDVVARHEEPLAPHTDTAARIAVLPGGAGANVACWAARCGARVRLLARVGADSADWHRAALLAAGVEPVLRVDTALPTAVVVALVDAAAERTLVTDSGAAFRLGPGDWDEGLLDDGPGGIGRVHLSGYLFFSAPGRELAAAVRKAALARGIPVSVDPASAGFLRTLGTDTFLDAVQGSDLLLPNAAEAALLSGHEQPADAAAALSARCGGAAVVVTLGAAGALAAEGGAVVAWAAAPLTTPVDTTGAGDAFTGGLLAARLAGADLVAGLTAGCRTGADAVTMVGGRPNHPQDATHPGGPGPRGTGVPAAAAQITAVPDPPAPAQAAHAPAAPAPAAPAVAVPDRALHAPAAPAAPGPKRAADGSTVFDQSARDPAVPDRL